MRKAAVIYYSKLGNTEKIARAIAEGAGVEAVSIADEPALPEKTDSCFSAERPMPTSWPPN